MNAKLLEIQQTSASTYWCSGSGSGFSGNAASGNSWSAHASEAGAFSRSAVTQIDWSYQNGSYSAVGNVHTDFDASGEYVYSGENDSWWSESNSHSSGWYSFDDDNHNERESNETMVFHHERDENYEWSLDETGRVYVSGYSYTQSGSMSANGHRGGSGTHNYESSSYTQGDGWSSFYHSGSFGSGYFYDDYDFTADWSESFNGVTNSYSSAHSASNDVEGYEYNLSGYFSDYYNTWTGQSPDSGSYSDSYPSSNSYASTVTENGFSFTWNGWDVRTRQGVYIHNTPYSGIWDIPFGLGSWSNPVEQPNSAWSSEPETPEPYSSPSQRYVDDLDDFFYGYDNSDLYETGLQEYGEVTVTNASGSASYSGYENFYDDFTDGSVGNEGVGSGLSTSEKRIIKSQVIEISEYTIINGEPEISSSNDQLSLWNQTVETWTEQDDTTISLKIKYGNTTLPDKPSRGENKKPTVFHRPNKDVIPTDASPVTIELFENIEEIRKSIQTVLPGNQNIEYGGVILRKTELAPEKSRKYKVLRINIKNPQETTFQFPVFFKDNGHIYVPAGLPTGVIPPKTDFLAPNTLDRHYEVIATWHSHTHNGDALPSDTDNAAVMDQNMPDIMFHKKNKSLTITELKSPKEIRTFYFNWGKK